MAISIGRVLYPITSLGPGRRIVIWTQGCNKKCPKCSSPEYQTWDNERELAPESFIAILSYICGKTDIDGITISGGDPFEQNIEDLLTLIEGLRAIKDDILVYTGYTWEELKGMLSPEEMEVVKKNVSVLIDGRYRDDLNVSDCPLRGSTNQRIHFFDESKREKYEVYMAEGRKLQNVTYGEGMLCIGIQNKQD